MEYAYDPVAVIYLNGWMRFLFSHIETTNLLCTDDVFCLSGKDQFFLLLSRIDATVTSRIEKRFIEIFVLNVNNILEIT